MLVHVDLPADRSGRAVEAEQRLATRDEDGVAVDGRRSDDESADLCGPTIRAGPGVDGVHLARPVAEVGNTVRDDRSTGHADEIVDRPLLLEPTDGCRGDARLTRAQTGVGEVVPVDRPIGLDRRVRFSAYRGRRRCGLRAGVVVVGRAARRREHEDQRGRRPPSGRRPAARAGNGLPTPAAEHVSVRYSRRQPV